VIKRGTGLGNRNTRPTSSISIQQAPGIPTAASQYSVSGLKSSALPLPPFLLRDCCERGKKEIFNSTEKECQKGPRF